VKVFIADDSAAVVERLITMLSELPQVEIIGHAQDAREAIKATRQLNPDVVILDIRMPGGSGIDVLKDIKSNKPTPVVIMLTNYPYPQYRKVCMALGANFFCDKSTEFEKVTEVLG
jgi:DNA-binding NarL/FixJ family response regulator